MNYDDFVLLLFILPIFPIRGRGVYTPDIPYTGWWSLYSRYSLYGVVEFILPIFPVQGRGVYTLIFPIRGRGVYTPDIPCTGSWSLYSDIPYTGSWSLYSQYSLYGVVEFILPIFPIRGRGVYITDVPSTGSWSLYSDIPCTGSWSLELSTKLRSDALPVTTSCHHFLSPPLTFLGFESTTHCMSCILPLMVGSNRECSLSVVKERSFRANRSSRLMT